MKLALIACDPAPTPTPALTPTLAPAIAPSPSPSPSPSPALTHYQSVFIPKQTSISVQLNAVAAKFTIESKCKCAKWMKLTHHLPINFIHCSSFSSLSSCSIYNENLIWGAGGGAILNFCSSFARLLLKFICPKWWLIGTTDSTVNTL